MSVRTALALQPISVPAKRLGATWNGIRNQPRLGALDRETGGAPARRSTIAKILNRFCANHRFRSASEASSRCLSWSASGATAVSAPLEMYAPFSPDSVGLKKSSPSTGRSDSKYRAQASGNEQFSASGISLDVSFQSRRVRGIAPRGSVCLSVPLASGVADLRAQSRSGDADADAAHRLRR